MIVWSSSAAALRQSEGRLSWTLKKSAQAIRHAPVDPHYRRPYNHITLDKKALSDIEVTVGEGTFDSHRSR